MAKHDANEFARRIATIAANVEGNVNKIVQQAAIAIESRLVTATPVDTGRARSNWLASLGSPRQDIVEPTSAAATLANATSVILQRSPSRSVTVWLSNNVRYIGRLNAGSSEQAPAAFVESAVAAGAAVVKGGRLLR